MGLENASVGRDLQGYQKIKGRTEDNSLHIVESEPNVIVLFMLINYKSLDLTEARLAEDKAYWWWKKSFICGQRRLA